MTKDIKGPEVVGEYSPVVTPEIVGEVVTTEKDTSQNHRRTSDNATLKKD